MGAPLSIPRRRLTIANFHAMIAAGVLTEDERIELIDGELLQMAPIGALHARTVTALQEIFSKQAAGEVVWVQTPISLPRDNEPQPDLAILRPGFRGETGLPAAADVLL